MATTEPREQQEQQEQQEQRERREVRQTKSKTMWVRAVTGVDHNGKEGEHLVLLYEQDDRHPLNKEAFIAGPIPVQVADTTAVVTLLKNGDIEEVREGEARRAGSAPDANARVDEPAQAALAARTAELDRREKELDAKAKQLDESSKTPQAKR